MRSNFSLFLKEQVEHLQRNRVEVVDTPGRHVVYLLSTQPPHTHNQKPQVKTQRHRIQLQIHPPPCLELKQLTIQLCCQVRHDFVQSYQICKTVNMQKTSDVMFPHIDVFVMVLYQTPKRWSPSLLWHVYNSMGQHFNASDWTRHCTKLLVKVNVIPNHN